MIEVLAFVGAYLGIGVLITCALVALDRNKSAFGEEESAEGAMISVIVWPLWIVFLLVTPIALFLDWQYRRRQKNKVDQCDR
jgi:heme/copper-type cytochrome/quinol oxidase subunit 2